MSKDLLKERYQILNPIGEGGIGKTFLALDNNTHKKVVVKKLKIQEMDNWKTFDLFEREAKVLSQLDHPYIPDYIDYFQVETEKQTDYFIVQEYIEGKTIKQKIEMGWQITEDQAVNMIEKLLKILHYLQSFSPAIIHRDINPRNIIISDEDIYLVDFGAVQNKTAETSGGSTVVGTYGFMPMEQLMGKAVPASDIYSLAVTIIFLLTHKSPDQLPLKNNRIQYESYVKISDNFQHFLNQCIDPNVNKRPKDAKETMDKLKKCLSGIESLWKSWETPGDFRIKIYRKKEKVYIEMPFSSGKKVLNIFLKVLSFILIFISFFNLFLTSITQGYPNYNQMTDLFPVWIFGLVLYSISYFINYQHEIVLKTDRIKVLGLSAFFRKSISLKSIQSIDIIPIQPYGRDVKYTKHYISINQGMQNTLIDDSLEHKERQWLITRLKDYIENFT